MTKRKSALDGLKVTVTYVGSGNQSSRRSRPEVPEVNVAALRAKTGLSQHEFAQSIGVATGTLVNWEQGRRSPTGPAQVLLAILAKKPFLLKELFAKRHLYQPWQEATWLHGGRHPYKMTHEERMAEIYQILGNGIARLKAKTRDTERS
jgi:putative transcriptional regulator